MDDGRLRSALRRYPRQRGCDSPPPSPPPSGENVPGGEGGICRPAIVARKNVRFRYNFCRANYRTSRTSAFLALYFVSCDRAGDFHLEKPRRLGRSMQSFSYRRFSRIFLRFILDRRILKSSMERERERGEGELGRVIFALCRSPSRLYTCFILFL